MRALLRAIASVLRSWLSSVRGEPAARRLDGPRPQGGVSRDAGSGVGDAGTQASAEPPAVENVGRAAPPEKRADLLCDNGARENPEELHAATVPDTETIVESDGQAAGERGKEHDGVSGMPQVELGAALHQVPSCALEAGPEDAGEAATRPGVTDARETPSAPAAGRDEHGLLGAAAAGEEGPKPPNGQAGELAVSEAESEPDNPASPVFHAGEALHDGDERGRESDAPVDLAAGGAGEDCPVTADEETRPCPRCGTTCPRDEVEQVFGHRTMRWSAAGRETTAVRRQSYCRQCRAEHAAEMREGEPAGSSEAPAGDDAAGKADGEESQIAEDVKPRAPAEPFRRADEGQEEAEDQVVDGDGTQLVDAPATVGTDDRAAEALDQLVEPPGDAGEASGSGTGGRPAGAEGGPGAEPALGQENEQEARNAIEARAPVEHPAEEPEGYQPPDHVRQLPEEFEKEEIASTGNDAERGVDPQVGSDAPGAPKAGVERASAAPERNLEDETDTAQAIEPASREVIEEERVPLGDGGPRSPEAGGPTTPPADADGHVAPRLTRGPDEGQEEVEDQVAGGDGTRFVDSDTTVEAEDGAAEAHDQLTEPPGEAGEASDSSTRGRPAGEEGGPGAEADLGREDEQEARNAAEAGASVERPAEDREGGQPADHFGQLPEEVENEEIAGTSSDAGSPDTPEAPKSGDEEGSNAPQPDPEDETDTAHASYPALGEVVEEEQVPVGGGGPSSPEAGGLSATPEADADGHIALGTTRERQRRRAPQYRAPAGGPPPRRQSSKRRPRTESGDPSPTRGRPAAIEVRVIFQRGGYCSVSLLPKRLPGLPEELTVSGTAGDVELQALQDEWYQDVAPDTLPDLLLAGFAWKHVDTGQEWLLSGREVFVLAHGTTHRGFVSCPRLTLGRDHVVLCTAMQLRDVEVALRAAGCAGWTELGEDDGAPSGWRVLRGVVPQNPVPQSSDSDILNVLRPLPEIEIALEGGIRLAYNSWLLGYPPSIRIYGDPEHVESVLIDGQAAIESERRGFTTQGWDAEGEHQIWCSSSNKSYSLVRCEASWSYWPAYSFALRGAGGEGSRAPEFEFCGPVVRPVANSEQVALRQPVQVPPANRVLLGAGPGEVFVVRQRPDIRGARCLGLPPFDPVWALPLQPLTCDKRTNRILLVGEPTPRCGEVSQRSEKGCRDLERWCRLVLDASRKGLAVEPAAPATHSLWLEYKQLARNLWRRLR